VLRTLLLELDGPHERYTREEVRRAKAPLLDDGRDDRPVEREEARPEHSVLLSKGAVEPDVKSVVEEKKLQTRRLERARVDDHVLCGSRHEWSCKLERFSMARTWMRVAVHPAPVKDLCAERVHHALHDLLHAALEQAGMVARNVRLRCRWEPVVCRLNIRTNHKVHGQV
jgi:hypothetical protein